MVQLLVVLGAIFPGVVMVLLATGKYSAGMPKEDYQNFAAKKGKLCLGIGIFLILLGLLKTFFAA